MAFGAALPFALQAGATLYDVLRGDKGTPSIDISGELSRIGSLFEEQRNIAKANSARALGEANMLSASNLAGRGVYSSPVSEYTFSRNQDYAGRDLANTLGQIGGAEASSRASILGHLMGYDAQSKMLAYNRKRDRENSLLRLLLGSTAAYSRGGGSIFDLFGKPAGAGLYGPTPPSTIPSGPTGTGYTPPGPYYGPVGPTG